MTKLLNDGLWRKLRIFTLGCLLLSIGICLATKADLGIAVYDAFILNISMLTKLTYGNISVIMGLLLVGLQIILTRKWQLSYVVQMGVLLTFSLILDAMMYGVFNRFEVSGLGMQIGFFVVANILICLGIALILCARLQSFPLETSMNVIYDKFGFPISWIKYGYDAVWLILAIVIGFAGKLTDYHLGLGTAIMFVLHGWLINFFFEKLNHYLHGETV